MQNLSTRLLVMLFVLTLLAAGCAKKPVAEEAVVEETPQVSVVEEQQPVAVVEESVNEMPSSSSSSTMSAAEKAAAGLMRVYFDFDQYLLTDVAKDTLANNAKLLKAAPGVMVKIEGHCDERGSDEYNLALGEKRALATKNYLVSLGVSASRLSVISYGEEMPLDPAKTETAWAKNRRAEFKVKR
ncbi:peptidoglycan-associated lipoprotein [Malonomonas rubra DSM 5091]|uniref:Peptidoglycan-associated lipoprotein n=1 Tax=Malonomonas rubra DSM 5091 TaxID=1122189 RepID=A0A1M6JRH7_MALRU|nr:peptidoglycan-associated lipoprotein Pal [Malonomonas rubra]SHJ49327.1 peptidoglycan-associated lipoprotein [Malonomonas rubra DSM 5091]